MPYFGQGRQSWGRFIVTLPELSGSKTWMPTTSAGMTATISLMSPNPTSPVLLDVDHRGVARVVLNRPERNIFSVDHPYGSMVAARAFLEQIAVSAADRERIAHGNAERLFKV